MNTQVSHYAIAVDYPTVSGAEHLDMLALRDQIYLQEDALSAADKRHLYNADRRLVSSSATFYESVKEFIDLVEYRRSEGISPDRWWWYLDVLSKLPQPVNSMAA